MEVTLNGFRCYSEETRFEFRDTEVNLLTGNSGKGKSTIFEAITYCFYGGIRNTSTRGKNTKKMWVEVKYKGCSIYRQRNPGLLTFKRGKITLKGPSAQSEINRRFGSSDLWYCTSYISQGGSNYIINAPPAARLETLGKLVFESDDPADYQEKIDKKQKEITRLMLEEKVKFDHAAMRLDNYINKANPEEEDILTEEELEDINTSLNDLKLKVEENNSLYLKDSVLVGKRKVLTDRIKEIKESLGSLSLTSQEEINETVESLKISENYLALKNRYKEISSLLSMASKRLSDEIKEETFEAEDLKETIILERKIKTEKAKLRKLDRSIKYTSSSIKKSIDKRKEEILINEEYQEYEALVSSYKNDYSIYQKELKLYKQERKQRERIISGHKDAQDLEDEIKNIAKDLLITVTEEIVDTIKDSIRSMKISKDVIDCPECSSPLRYKDSKLEKAETNNIFDQSSFDQLNEDLRINQRHLKTKDKLKSMEKELERIRKELTEIPEDPDLPVAPKKVEAFPYELGKTTRELLKEISVLESIEIIDLPYWSSSDLEDWLEWDQIKHQLEKIKDPGEKTMDRPGVILKRLNKMKSENERILWLEEDLAKTSDRLKSMDEPVENLDILPDIVNSCKDKINQLAEKIEASTSAKKMIKIRESFFKIKSRMEKINKLSISMSEMKEVAKSVEYKCMAGIVKNINVFLEEKAEDIFDEPITLHLSMTKELKTKKTTKNSIVLEVLYKGSETTDIKSYSGGERERFNILITLAIHRICGNGILIFDESLSCIDEETKDKCLELIKDSTSGSTVLLVDHSACKGQYNQIEV